MRDRVAGGSVRGSLTPGAVDGDGRGATGGNGVRAVRIALPADGSVRLDVDELVLEGGAGRQRHGVGPEGTGGSVTGGGQGGSGGGGPATELRDGAGKLDCLADDGGRQGVEGHGNVGSRGAGTSGGGSSSS